MPALPIREFVAEVLAVYAPPAKAPATFGKMRQALREFSATDGVATTADLRAPAVARWANAQLAAGRHPNTVHGLLSCLRAASHYAVEAGYLDASPFTRRRSFVRREKSRAPRHHPREAVARALAHAARQSGRSWDDGRVHALVAVLAYAGLRKHEALGLRWADVDLAAGMLRVEPGARRLKTRAAAAPVPCPDALLAVLAAWRPRCGSEWVLPGVRKLGPWVGGMPGRKPTDRVKALGREAGVEGLTCHSLRHSLATHLTGHWRLGRRQVQLVLRHANATTQEHYCGDDLENLRGLVRGFTYAPRPAPRADRRHVLPRRRFGRGPDAPRASAG